MLLSMTLVPFASLVVMVTSVIMLIDGEWLTLVLAFGLFAMLQLMLSILAILVADDDLKLALYSPLFIIGYKQFLDFTMIKAMLDIIVAGGTYIKRERVTRIGDTAKGQKAPPSGPLLELPAKPVKRAEN